MPPVRRGRALLLIAGWGSGTDGEEITVKPDTKNQPTKLRTNLVWYDQLTAMDRAGLTLGEKLALTVASTDVHVSSPERTTVNQEAVARRIGGSVDVVSSAFSKAEAAGLVRNLVRGHNGQNGVWDFSPLQDPKSIVAPAVPPRRRRAKTLARPATMETTRPAPTRAPAASAPAASAPAPEVPAWKLEAFETLWRDYPPMMRVDRCRAEALAAWMETVASPEEAALRIQAAANIPPHVPALKLIYFIRGRWRDYSRPEEKKVNVAAEPAQHQEAPAKKVAATTEPATAKPSDAAPERPTFPVPTTPERKARKAQLLAALGAAVRDDLVADAADIIERGAPADLRPHLIDLDRHIRSALIDAGRGFSGDVAKVAVQACRSAASRTAPPEVWATISRRGFELPTMKQAA